jgi:2',3'-cyclic-nucleotide 2'-phosphodiesterase (5'-nucleotidase family)
MKRFLIAIVAVLSVVQCTHSPEVKQAQTTPAPGHELIIAHESNRRAELEPCGCSVNPFGGIDREANALSELRNQSKNVIYVDAGDMMVSLATKTTSKHKLKKAELIVSLMNDLKLNAYSPGPVDYLLGVSSLKKLQKKALFPFVSTNIVEPSGKTLFEPYTILTVPSHLKVAIVSATPKATEGLNVKDPISSLNELLPKLKSQSDIVVLLSQYSADESKKISEAVPGIQVIVGADEKMNVTEAFWMNQGNTLYVDTTNEGQRLGVLSLDFVLPFKGFFSETVRQKNLANRLSLEAHAKAHSEDSATANYLKAYTNSNYFTENPLGSFYSHELISLSPEKYGKPNEFSLKLKAAKKAIKETALSE